MNLAIEYKKTKDLIPYARNSRTHSEEQVIQIASSIKEFGFTNPVLIDEDGGIIAGHGRIMAAKKLNLAEVPTITLKGLSEAQKKAYIIADNKLALNAGWDEELLRVEFDELKELDFDLTLTGFSLDEINDLDLELENENESDNPYTQKIDAPTYEPNDEKPNINDLFNNEKSKYLIQEIKNSNLNEDEKNFLILASYRHIVFNYEKIANFYAHSSKECQDLMEKSALVIIDFNKAIENGFVKITEEINEMIELEQEDE